jgi:hypothetical protein
VHTVHVEVAAQRQLLGKRRGTHARNAAHRGERVVEETRLDRILVEAMPGELDLHREETRRIEADVDGENALEASQQQARAHEQHE